MYRAFPPHTGRRHHWSFRSCALPVDLSAGSWGPYSRVNIGATRMSERVSNFFMSSGIKVYKLIVSNLLSLPVKSNSAQKLLKPSEKVWNVVGLQGNNAMQRC